MNSVGSSSTRRPKTVQKERKTGSAFEKTIVQMSAIELERAMKYKVFQLKTPKEVPHEVSFGLSISNILLLGLIYLHLRSLFLLK